VELSDPAGAVLADEIGMVTIIDDDGASLVAATAPIEHVGKDDALSHDALTPIVEAAKARWTDAMALNPATLELLDAVSFEIVGLPGLLFGQVVGNTVRIDLNGAGHGWFVDSTPYDDTEFQEGSRDGLLATYSSPAHGDMDLLTVIMHKIGHVFDLENLDSRTGDLMSPTLDVGARRLDADAAITTMAPEEQVYSLHLRRQRWRLMPECAAVRYSATLYLCRFQIWRYSGWR
jgi:hypothetical protein